MNSEDAPAMANEENNAEKFRIHSSYGIYEMELGELTNRGSHRVYELDLF